MTDIGCMHAQLVGSTGIRFHFEPGQVVSRFLDDAIIRDRMIGIRFAVLANAHLVTVRCLIPDEPRGNLVLTFARNTLHQCPIGLLGVAFAESGGQCLCCTTCARHNQYTGCVAVNTMDKTRLFAPLVAPGFQHSINVPCQTRSALDGETGRFVENEHFRIFIEKHLRKHVTVLLAADCPRRDRPSGFSSTPRGGIRTVCPA